MMCVGFVYIRWGVTMNYVTGPDFFVDFGSNEFHEVYYLGFTYI